MKTRWRIPLVEDIEANMSLVLAGMWDPIDMRYMGQPFGSARVLQVYDEYIDIEIELAEGVTVAFDVGKYTAAERSDTK